MVNRGDTVAVLERVSLVGASPGLTLTATRVAGARRGSIPAMASWPNEDFLDVHAVKGYRLVPNTTRKGKAGAALVLIMRAARPGRYTVDAVEVTYKVGARRYKARVRSAFAVCSVPDLNGAGTCKAPARED